MTRLSHVRVSDCEVDSGPCPQLLVRLPVRAGSGGLSQSTPFHRNQSHTVTWSSGSGPPSTPVRLGPSRF